MEKQLREAFDAHVKSVRGAESFSVLMCDLETCAPRQRELLVDLLLSSPASWMNPKLWLDYVLFLRQAYPNRRYLLTRLLRKAFELICEKTHCENEDLLQLHLIMCDLCQDPFDTMEYLETIYSRSVGRKSATLFLRWAKLSESLKDSASATDILQKGLDSSAEPRKALLHEMARLKDVAGKAALSSKRREEKEEEMRPPLADVTNRQPDLKRSRIKLGEPRTEVALYCQPLY